MSVKWIQIIALSAFLMGVFLSSGCQTRVARPDAVPFYQLYQPIESAEVDAFMAAGLKKLTREYGPLEFPVQQVLLRRSEPNGLGQQFRIAQHFSLTEIVDAEKGIFAIYIAVPPEDEEFYPLLAHELGHLKRPSLKDDWDMEGFCMVFSEELCLAEGKDWTVWTRRFSGNADDPYAKAYRKILSKGLPESL